MTDKAARQVMRGLMAPDESPARAAVGR